MQRFTSIAKYSLLSVWLRWSRLFKHLVFPLYKCAGHLKPDSWYDWPVDLVFYLADCIFLTDILEFISVVAKPQIRTLNNLEFAILNEVYGETVKLDYIKLDTTAKFLTQKYAIAYVSFNTINYWNSMMDQILVHEVMHVYQYQKFGSVYIYRALKAQSSEDAYNYGGIPGLVKAKEIGKTLFDFNFEQQASIIEDYYEVSQRMDLIMMPGLMALYQHFRSQLF